MNAFNITKGHYVVKGYRPNFFLRWLESKWMKNVESENEIITGSCRNATSWCWNLFKIWCT